MSLNDAADLNAAKVVRARSDYDKKIQYFLSHSHDGIVFDCLRRGKKPPLKSMLYLALKGLFVDLPVFLIRFAPNPFGIMLRNLYAKLTFKKFGKNSILDFGVIVDSPENVSVSDFVWIDRHAELNARCGYITIGRRVHISPNCTLSGLGGIVIEDYVGISRDVHIFSHSESPVGGKRMSGPMIPEEYKGMVTRPVVLKKDSFIGTGTVILPGVTVHESAVVGANSVVKQDVPAWTVVAGNPALVIGKRRPVTVPDI